MGYIRLDMTTSKSLVAAHTLLFPKIIFLSVTSLSGHFWFHIVFYFELMYVCI